MPAHRFYAAHAGEVLDRNVGISLVPPGALPQEFWMTQKGAPPLAPREKPTRSTEWSGSTEASSCQGL